MTEKLSPEMYKEAQKALTNNLFNNNMVKNARKEMSQELKDEYEKLSHHVGQAMDVIEGDPLNESAAYITEGLKSGLHPSYLEENEKQVMKTLFGDEWYKKWGWDTLEL